MQDQAAVVRDWLSSGHRVAFARVINRVGFSGDTELELLACTEDGEVTGDLLAGTVVDTSMAAMRKVLDNPAAGPEILSAQVHLKEAVDAGLSCGGSAHVLVQPAHSVPGELWSALAAQRPVVLPPVSAVPSPKPGPRSCCPTPRRWARWEIRWSTMRWQSWRPSCWLVV
jgi:xanthine/CO dehydrogenase XdhC/CoxF family maturation factor